MKSHLENSYQEIDGKKENPWPGQSQSSQVHCAKLVCTCRVISETAPEFLHSPVRRAFHSQRTKDIRREQAYPTVCNRNGGIPRHLPPLLELRLCARVLVRMHVYIDGLNVWNKIFNLI